LNIISQGINPVPVDIGDFTVYAEKIRISSSKTIAEGTTLRDELVYTKHRLKSTVLFLSGRIYGEDGINFALFADSAIRSGLSLDIVYKNITFDSCRFISSVCEDNSDGFFDFKLEFITPAPIKEVNTNAS